MIKVSFGLAFVLFLVYVRLFRKTMYLYLTPEHIGNYEWFFCYAFCLSIMLLILHITIFMRNEDKPSIFTKIFMKSRKLWVFPSSALNETYDLFCKLSGNFFLKYSVRFAYYVTKLPRKYDYLVVGLFIMLPRVIIVVILITEIYYGVLHYYFYALILLIVPLIFRFLLHILRDIHQRRFNIFCEEYFGSTVIVNTPQLRYPYDICFNITEILEWIYYPLLTIPEHVSIIDQKYKRVLSLTLIAYFAIKAICWAYILLYLIV